MDNPDKVMCRPEEADMLRGHLAMLRTAERELQVAFSMFTRSHGLPDGTTLHGVTEDGIVLVRPA